MNLVTQVLDHEARKCERNIADLEETINDNRVRLAADIESLEATKLLLAELKQAKKEINK